MPSSSLTRSDEYNCIVVVIIASLHRHFRLSRSCTINIVSLNPPPRLFYPSFAASLSCLPQIAILSHLLCSPLISHHIVSKSDHNCTTLLHCLCHITRFLAPGARALLFVSSHNFIVWQKQRQVSRRIVT